MARDITKPPSSKDISDSLATDSYNTAKALEDDAYSVRKMLEDDAYNVSKMLFDDSMRVQKELEDDHERIAKMLEDDYTNTLNMLLGTGDHKDEVGRDIDAFGDPIDDLEEEDPTEEDDSLHGDGTLHIYKRNATGLIPDGADGSGTSTDPEEAPDLSVDTTLPTESAGEMLVRKLYEKYSKGKNIKVGNHHCETPLIDESGKVGMEVEPGLIDEKGGKYNESLLDEILDKILGLEVDPADLYYTEPEPEPPAPPPSLTAQEMFEMIRYKPRLIEPKTRKVINVSSSCCTPATPAPAPAPEPEKKPEPLRPKVSDIVFIIDTTGSMSGVLDQVKANINAYADKLKAKGVDVRLGLVVYGDIKLGEAIVKKDFTTNVDTFKGWINTVPRYKGGDTPESTLDAINDPTKGAKSFTFRENATREYIVITDAIAHTVSDGKSPYTNEGTLASLRADHVITSFITQVGGVQEAQYKPIADGTTGKVVNIYGNFSEQLEILAENTDDSFYRELPS